jgi:MFS family permease
VFLYYLTIGLLLAVLPGFIHLHLGLSPFWAGVAISSQYLATLATRSKAGRMTDVLGPRATVLVGQAVGLLSGLCLIVAASLQSKAVACFVVLLISRLILGCGESCVATGATTWGLGRVDATYAAQVISWSGIASYGAMAAGAPLGIWLETRYGLESIGAAASGVSLLNLALALPVGRGADTARRSPGVFEGARQSVPSRVGTDSRHGWICCDCDLHWAVLCQPAQHFLIER